MLCAYFNEKCTICMFLYHVDFIVVGPGVGLVVVFSCSISDLYIYYLIVFLNNNLNQ